MARMVSPAGEMDVKVERISTSRGQLIITGQIGVWDSDIYLEPEEVFYLAKFMIKLPFISYLLTLPFTYLKRRIHRKRESDS